MIVPKWFERELKIIDPRYYPVWNTAWNYWEIKCRLELSRSVENPKTINNGEIIKLSLRNPTVAVFQSLSEDSLFQLRKRKYIGLKFHRAYDGNKAYIEDVLRRNAEAKSKKEELAAELMAEGYMKIYDLEHKKTYVGSSSQFKEGENHDPSGA